MAKRRWESETGTWGIAPGDLPPPGLDPDRLFATHGRLTELDELGDQIARPGPRTYSGERVFAREVMRPCSAPGHPTTALSEVLERMHADDLDALPIVDDEARLIGIVTRSAAKHALEAAPSERPLTATDAMVTDVPATYPDMRILSLLDLMRRRHLATVPVVDRDGQLAGIVSLEDVASIGLYDDQVKRVRRALAGGRFRAWWSRRRPGAASRPTGKP